MDLLIFRQFDEWIELKSKKCAVTAMKPVGKISEEQAEIVCIELSKKQAGIFWVEYPFQKTTREKFMFRYEEKEEGAPDYVTFKAGYQNGKQIFPKIGEVKSSAVKES